MHERKVFAAATSSRPGACVKIHLVAGHSKRYLPTRDQVDPEDDRVA